MFRALCPRLTPDNHRSTSPQSPHYNCLAWSVNCDYWYIWPDEEEQYAWPEGMAREDTIECVVAFFRRVGFAICSTDALEPNREKIAIFSWNGIPTHIARQLPNGRWTNKLADLADIEHETAADVGGGKYGEIDVVMVRDGFHQLRLPRLVPFRIVT